MLLNKFKLALKKFFNTTKKGAKPSQTETSTQAKPHNYVFISRQGYKELLEGHSKKLELLTDKELICNYNHIFENKGIPSLGNTQGLYLMAMHNQFMDRFEKSPIIK